MQPLPERSIRLIGQYTIVAAVMLFVAPNASAQLRRPMTIADVEGLVTELSNWGRWGKDDQLGTLNLITAEKRREAARLVREGISVSLARNVEKRQTSDNPNPFVHTMLAERPSRSGAAHALPATLTTALRLVEDGRTCAA